MRGDAGGPGEEQAASLLLPSAYTAQVEEIVISGHRHTVARAGAAAAWRQAPNITEVPSLGCGRVPWAPCGETNVLLLCWMKIWHLLDSPCPGGSRGRSMGRKSAPVHGDAVGSRTHGDPAVTSKLSWLWLPKRSKS